MHQGRAVKTATDHAAEAVEAAEIMSADETGAALDLSPAAKVALILKIAAAIDAAVAEERQGLRWVLVGLAPTCRPPLPSRSLQHCNTECRLIARRSRRCWLRIAPASGRTAPIGDGIIKSPARRTPDPVSRDARPQTASPPAGRTIRPPAPRN